MAADERRVAYLPRSKQMAALRQDPNPFSSAWELHTAGRSLHLEQLGAGRNRSGASPLAVAIGHAVPVLHPCSFGCVLQAPKALGVV